MRSFKGLPSKRRSRWDGSSARPWISMSLKNGLCSVDASGSSPSWIFSLPMIGRASWHRFVPRILNPSCSCERWSFHLVIDTAFTLKICRAVPISFSELAGKPYLFMDVFGMDTHAAGSTANPRQGKNTGARNWHGTSNEISKAYGL